MAISRVGSANGTTSATIPAHQAGDLILCFAFRDGVATPPSLPSGQGWQSMVPTFRNGNLCAHRCHYKIAAGSSEVTGTFTSATALIVEVYRGVDQVTPIGNTAVNSGTGTLVDYPPVAFQNADGSSWAAGFAGHRSTDTLLGNPPSGMSLVNNLTNGSNEAAGHDTNGGVTGWADQTVEVAGTSSDWTSHVLEIRAAASASQPTLDGDIEGVTVVGAAANHYGMEAIERGIVTA